MTLVPLRGIAEKSLIALLVAFICSYSATVFGNPQLFDPMTMAVSTVLLYAFRKDVNLFTLIGIFVLVQLIEEITWMILGDSLYTKVPLYLFMLLVIPHVSQAGLKLYLMMFVGSAVCVEVYWLYTSYEPVPGIYWQVWMTVLTAISLRAINLRVFWLIELTGDERLEHVKLDYYMARVQLALIVFYSLITFEYYIRHLLGHIDFTYIYDFRPIWGNTLSIFVIYMIVIESRRHISKADLSI